MMAITLVATLIILRCLAQLRSSISSLQSDLRAPRLTSYAVDSLLSGFPKPPRQQGTRSTTDDILRLSTCWVTLPRQVLDNDAIANSIPGLQHRERRAGFDISGPCGRLVVLPVSKAGVLERLRIRWRTSTRLRSRAAYLQGILYRKPPQGLEPWTPALRKLINHFPALSRIVLDSSRVYT
jgi:hypothetical protein